MRQPADDAGVPTRFPRCLHSMVLGLAMALAGAAWPRSTRAQAPAEVSATPPVGGPAPSSAGGAAQNVAAPPSTDAAQEGAAPPSTGAAQNGASVPSTGGTAQDGAAPGATGDATEDATTPSSAGDAASATFTPRLLVQTDAVILRHGPDAPAISDGTTHPGLYLRRARVGADAVAGFWRARTIVEGASQSETADSVGTVRTLDAIAGEIGGKAPRVTEAFVAFAAQKAFVVTAGAQRVPIGLSRQIDEADLRLPERARIITRATPDFRVGVAASGDLGMLQYALGAYSAAPTFGSDFAGGGMLSVLRLSGEPIGPLGVAPQLRRHDDPWSDWWRFSAGLTVIYAALPGANEFGLGGDGQLQWSRLCVTGEMLWTNRDAADRIGFTVEPGVFLWTDRLELVARIEWFNDQVGPRSGVDAWGTSLGATFFSITRQARLQAAYTLRRADAGDKRVAGWAVLRATFVL